MSKVLRSSLLQITIQKLEAALQAYDLDGRSKVIAPFAPLFEDGVESDTEKFNKPSV